MSNITRIKCIFPQLVNTKQKMLCVATGVLLGGLTFEGLYYNRKRIEENTSKFLDTTFSWIEKYKKKSEGRNENYKDNIHNKKSYSKHIFNVTMGVIQLINPLCMGSVLFFDTKKYIKAFSDTTECCTIIRKTSLRTFLYPPLIALSIFTGWCGCKNLKDEFNELMKK